MFIPHLNMHLSNYIMCHNELHNYGPGRGCITNSGLNNAKDDILKKLNKLPNTELQVVTLRAQQGHLKRRQDYGKKIALSDPASKNRKQVVPEMGQLANFPGLREHLIIACAAPVPEVRRLHLPIQLIGQGHNEIGTP